MIKINIRAVILEGKDGDKQVGNSWYKYSSTGIECPKLFSDAISIS